MSRERTGAAERSADDIPGAVAATEAIRHRLVVLAEGADFDGTVSAPLEWHGPWGGAVPVGSRRSAAILSVDLNKPG